MAIWLALIVVVFLTRGRWEAWVVEQELPPAPGALVEKLEVSPDAGRLLVRYWNGEEVLWDVRSGRLLAHFEAREERWQMDPFSRNGKRLVVIGRQVRPDGPAAGTIPESRAGPSTYIVDARTGNVLLSLEGSRRIGLSPDGRHFLEIRSRGEVVIRSAETGEPVRVLQTGSDWTSDAVCSPDGRWIATHDSFGEPSSVRIWDAHTGRPAAAQPEDVGPVWEVRFSPNVQHVFAALSYGKACCLWDLRTGKRIVRIECAPDSRHYVSRDGSLLLVHRSRVHHVPCSFSSRFTYDVLR